MLKLKKIINKNPADINEILNPLLYFNAFLKDQNIANDFPQILITKFNFHLLY